MGDYLEFVLTAVRIGFTIALAMAAVVAAVASAVWSVKFLFGKADATWGLRRALWVVAGTALLVFYCSAAVGSGAYCAGSRLSRPPAEATR
jgi:hypothetical protein